MKTAEKGKMIKDMMGLVGEEYIRGWTCWGEVGHLASFSAQVKNADVRRRWLVLVFTWVVGCCWA